MKLPLKKFKLGYREIQIRGFLDNENPGLYGSYYPNRNIIAINLDGMETEQELMNTVLHELLHAIWYEKRLDRKEGSPTEEEVVLAFSDGLCEVFKRNKNMVKYINDYFTN